MKTCIACKETKATSDFHKNCRTSDGIDTRCKKCKKIEAKLRRENNYFQCYISTKRSECKRKGYAFNLTAEYLEDLWTGICPIFGVHLHRASEGKGSHKSAHLDRLDSSKGYVVGNVAWISGRANRIKYDATVEELRAIADWMEGATTIPKGSTLEA